VVLNIVDLPVLQIGQKFSQPKGKGEDTYYSRGRSMLQELGLQNYEKNLKKGLLTDQTLPLLTDRYLCFPFSKRNYKNPIYVAQDVENPRYLGKWNVTCGILGLNFA
jgi:hypothetical protein